MANMQLALFLLGMVCAQASEWRDWRDYDHLHREDQTTKQATSIQSAAHTKSMEATHVMLKVDAKGGVEDANELARRTNNIAQHKANSSAKVDVSKATSKSEEKEIKAHVTEGHVADVKSGKLAETVVRSEAAVHSSVTFAQKFTMWKHKMLVKAQAKANSYWQRTRSNSTLRYPAELYPVEFLRSYCNEANADCWSNKPSDIQVCTAQRFSTNPNEVCRCSNSVYNIRCNKNWDVNDDVSVARCVDIKIYVSKAGEEEIQCAKLAKNTQWKTQLVAQKSDGPASKALPWHKTCNSGYVAKDGECKRKSRFLTESCWGSNSGGNCAGAETSHDEYSTSCYRGKCMAFDFIKESVECSCSWSGWRFPFTCSAESDQCGGHPCTWNADDGKSYCNFAERQNWNNTGILTGILTSMLTVLGGIFAILIVGVTMACLLTSSETKAFFFYQVGMAWAKEGTATSKA